jgi:ATP-dependent helicase/nuclease subunit B
MTRVTKTGERPDAARHADLMRTIAGEAVARWAEKIPPPSAGIFERERRDIDHALALFLSVESARPATVRPLLFEKRFDRVPIPIAGGRSFLLKGVIDRIDEIGPSVFRILDYKTGSPRRYQDLEAFGQGRIVQHALYAVAAEKILLDEGLAREARVTESGYFFPTRRGEGGEVIVSGFDRRAFEALLADILSLVSNGFFPTAVKDECRYCDYVSVCGGAPEATKKKIAANPKVSEILERLKAYD